MEKMIQRMQNGPTIGEKVFIAKNATLVGEVIVHEDANIWYNAVLRGDIDKIVVGKRSNVQDCAVLHVTKNKYPVIIGDDTSVGHAANLHGCVIGNNVLIGIGAIILDNTVIGDNSIVAAGTVVPPNKTFPAGSMIMGSPGKVVRSITAEEIEWVRMNAEKYVHYKDVYLKIGYK